MSTNSSSGKTAEENEKLQSVSRINLYSSVFIVYLTTITIGIIFCWTSPALPKLEAADSWLPVDTDQSSWIGSLSSLGACLSPFLGGWLVDRVGRRPTIVLSMIICLVSWIILYAAQRVEVIYAGRLVAGFSGGIMFMAIPLYVGEVAEVSIRSALASFFNFSLATGLVFVYIDGPYVSYWTTILSCCSVPVLFFVLSSWVPESPYYLLLKNQELEAFVSLSWLRKGHKDAHVFEELAKVKEEIEEASKNKGTFLDLVLIPMNRKALILSSGCVCFQQLCGMNVILFYAQNIFEVAGETFLSTSESAILMSVILLVAAGIGVPLTHRFGIRRMLIVSSLGMVVFLVLLGIFLFLQREGYDTTSFSFVPIASLICYVIIYSCGFGPGPWAVVAEVFPPNVKGKASAVSVSLCWLTNFVLTKLFPIIVRDFGLYIVVWAFAIFSLIGCLFVLTLLPDTRGLSFQQIQDILGSSETKRLDMETVAAGRDKITTHEDGQNSGESSFTLAIS